MKRGTKMVVLIVLLVILLTATIASINGKQMVSGSEKKLEKAVVTIYGNNNTDQVILKSREQLTEIFSILKNTNGIKFHINISDGVLQHDEKFMIKLYYSSGKIETIGATERGIFKNKKILFKKGVVIGKNEMIWKYVENLRKKAWI